MKAAKIDQVGVTSTFNKNHTLQDLMDDANNRALKLYDCHTLSEFKRRVKVTETERKEIDPIEELARKWKARL